jgi:regulator of replication initiation timing
MGTVNIHCRIEHEVEKLARKMAKEDYGSPKKLGKVVNDALKHYYAHKLHPTEAASILSNAEVFLLERVQNEVKDMTDRVINRIGDLYARTAFESCFNSFILEKWLQKEYGSDWKVEGDKLRKLARQRMTGRLEKNGAEEIAQIIEENAYLKKENQRLQEKASEFEELARTSKEKSEALEWLQDLIVFLTQRSPEAVELIREYDRTHERPKGL